MIRSFYTAVSGMITQEARQDVITNNLANSNTVGFKSETLGVKRFNDVLLQNYDKMQGGKNVRNEIGSVSLGSAIDSVDIGFTQGSIQDTGKVTDFAIDGKGFFAVQKNNGNNTGQYYTRDGHFHVSTNGVLVNDEGDAVLGRNLQTNALEPIKIGANDMTADPSGVISLNGTNAYRLYTADFNDYRSVKKVGDNLYQGNNPTEVNAIVKPNSLEKSNVNIVNAMSDMMSTMRSFETNQKVVQSLDETLGKLISEVGNTR